MNDPYQPGYSGRHDTESTGYPDVSYTDPAYAGQTPMYSPGYLPPYAYGSTGQVSQQPWTQGPPPPGQPPFTGVVVPPSGGEGPPPPEPPRSPRWLWLAAGAAVLLVTGLVVALVVVNGSTTRSTTLSPFPETPSTKASTPPRTPTVIPPPTTTEKPPGPTTTAPPPTGTSPTETSPPPPRAGATDSVVYDVTGEGRAISIIYIDDDGVVQTEFNVPLPWSKEVSLASSAKQTASVSVANIGEDVTCTVTVNGTQVSHRTGSILTVCMPLR